jgi:zinc/manganese transport system substrate-binding protein
VRASSGFRVATAAVGLSFAAALTLTACSSDTSSDGALTVVASTNVWGSVAQAVAGDKVEVSSIITEPSSDPHSFEASPTDAAKLTDASLIVYNGGGYDHFVDDIINTSSRSTHSNSSEPMHTQASPRTRVKRPDTKAKRPGTKATSTNTAR